MIHVPKQDEAFADAVENVAQNPLGYRTTSVRIVKNNAEFMQLMEKRRQLYG